ncbi:molybdenum cofactor biosynthesis protein MoaE [Sphingomonas sp. CJ99]
MKVEIRVQAEPIDLARAVSDIGDLEGIGAVASFTGLVRADDGVTALTLEHYPGMTEASLQDLAMEVGDRWSLAGVVIIHRVGTMRPGDRVVWVAAASTHRHDALQACAFLIDRLKTDAPFWKQEVAGGMARWVAPRDGDRDAADRWRSI